MTKVLISSFEKRRTWFIERIGKRIYRPPVKCDCESCKRGHLEGIMISNETHADYLYSVECELGLRYSDNPLPI